GGGAGQERLRRDARGRPHDRGPGPDGEPPGAGRRRPRVRVTGRGGGGGRLADFLQEISLYSDSDSLAEERSQVTLMTLHNAKGLEFPVVFMIGLEEGLFPHQRSLDELNDEAERRL